MVPRNSATLCTGGWHSTEVKEWVAFGARPNENPASATHSFCEFGGREEGCGKENEGGTASGSSTELVSTRN